MLCVCQRSFIHHTLTVMYLFLPLPDHSPSPLSSSLCKTSRKGPEMSAFVFIIHPRLRLAIAWLGLSWSSSFVTLGNTSLFTTSP